MDSAGANAVNSHTFKRKIKRRAVYESLGNSLSLSFGLNPSYIVYWSVRTFGVHFIKIV